MSGADTLRAEALSDIGNEYEWGEALEYGGRTPDKEDADCSGGCFGWWRDGGVPAANLGGRQTAHDYYRRGTKIDPAAAVCGDYICLLDATGHAHHIIMCVGNGETVEFKGERWGCIKSTIGECMSRAGAVCLTMPGVHEFLGDLTGYLPHVPTLMVPWPGVYLKVKKPLMKGEAVRQVQLRLLELGYSVGKYGSDGAYGNDTKAAVVRFQTERMPHYISGSNQWDGVVGKNTWTYLFTE